MIADQDRLLEAERECGKALKEMEQIQASLAYAKQIVGLRDDRIKKELAVLVVEGLKSDLSAAASEWQARADKRWTVACTRIMRETADAQEVINRWELLKLKYDNAQSLRNDERQRMRIV